MKLYLPWGLLALLGIPVIIILYILKQRHRDYSISSLHLWQHAIRDLEASTPWQKLRRNILMFLQILAVVILALILSEPAVKSRSNQSSSVLLILDLSLSMQSTDVKPSRFEAAKSDMEKLISSYSPGTEFSLIASGRKADIILHLAEDKNMLLREIRGLKATDCVSDMEGTFELMDSLARENPGMEIHWFGDRQYPLAGLWKDYDKDRFNYLSYRGQGVNYGVTMLSYRKYDAGAEMTVLSRISNFSGEKACLDVSLYTDGKLFDAQRVEVNAGKSESLYWQGVPASAETVECRIDTEDMLARDNSAFVRIYHSKAPRILLATENNLFLERVLSLLPDIELYRTTAEDIDGLKGFDIYIFDGISPAKLPEDGHIILFAPLDNVTFPLLSEEQYVTVKTSGHEFFSGLKQDTSFAAMKTYLYSLPVWADPLMETEEGIAAFEGYMGKNRLIVFGFDLHQTNLPVKPFFPILITRAVEALSPGNMQGLASIYAGDAVVLPISPESEKISVITPGGKRVELAPPFPVPPFDDTLEAGRYILEQAAADGVSETEFFVNVPSEKQFTDLVYGALAGSDELSGDKEEIGGKNGMPRKLDYNKPGEANGENDEKDPGNGKEALNENKRYPFGYRELKDILLWLLFILLLAEWWIYTNGKMV